MWTGIDHLGEANWPERSSSTGVLDTCGFEKDSFYFYQSIWNRREPMAHLLPHWNLELEPGTVIPVLGYTNCDSAELFVNGKSYGRKAYSFPAYGMTQEYGHFEKTPIAVNTSDLFLAWDVSYEPGCIELAGFRDGQEVVRDTVRTAGKPAAVLADCYQHRLLADGFAVGQIEITVVDAEGNLCPQSDVEVTALVDGPAFVAGMDNGNPKSMESMRENHIHVFGGRAFCVVQSSGAQGDCTVRLIADGLTGCEVCLTFDEELC